MSFINTADPMMLVVGMLFLSLILLCIAYPDRYVGTQPRHDLPGPTGYPIIGNLLEVLPFRRHTLAWIKHMQDSYGPVCTFTMAPWGRGIIINKPEWLAYVKQADMQRYSRGPIAVAIFTEFPGGRAPVASEGAEWRRARKTIFPIFTVKSFTEHVSCAMNEIVPMTCSLLMSASNQHVAIDWNDLAGRIALAIFCKSALDTDTNVLGPDVSYMNRSDALRDALLVLNRISSSRLFNPFWTWTERLNGDRTRFNRARSLIRRHVETIVRERQAALGDSAAMEIQTDYLSSLLNDPTYDDPVLVRDTLVTLLFAGRDNTQNALAWALHALMSTPVWISRMREEAIDNARYGQELDYSDLSVRIPFRCKQSLYSSRSDFNGCYVLAMAWLSANQRYHVHLAVFYETVRLWPGLPKNARLALCDDILPALPEHNLPAVKVDKGDYIFWSDYHMMRSESVWGQTANEFDPGRHLDSEGHFVKPTAPKFNGFGAGPRLCPAAQLVAYEFVACWAGILPHFNFYPLKGETADGRRYEEPRMTEAFTPALAGPFMMEVCARQT